MENEQNKNIPKDSDEIAEGHINEGTETPDKQCDESKVNFFKKI